MRYMNGDVLTLAGDGDAICCTTNGIVKSDGRAVMGKGIAKTFEDIFHVSDILGEFLTSSGNHVYKLGFYKVPNKNAYVHVLSFPTKNHWRDDSSLTLILQSARELKAFMDTHDCHTCYFPVPGCGCGHLKEADVLPELEKILDDDRFVCVRFSC